MSITNKQISNEKGITLIALVVTIVILIILATISINIIMQGGLINRTTSVAKLHDLEKERERLEMIKLEVASDANHLGNVTVDNYVQELIDKGITDEKEIVDNGDGSKIVITDTGYSVIIKPKGENDVEIIIEGKVGELPPIIKQVNVTKESTSIVVEVIAIRTEGATYSYEYQEVGGTWKPTGENKANITINGTEEEKSYVIKVTVKNEYGKDEVEKKVEVEDILPEPPALSDGMIPVKYVENKWVKTTADDPEWYNYSSSSKKWANVVLEDSSFIEEDGTEKLDTSKAYSQLVWIPRFAYQITNYYHTAVMTETVGGNINIVFIDRQNQNKAKNKTYSTTYPSYTIGEDTGMKDYVVHPAFNFGTNKLSGIWVGKYETSSVNGNGNSLDSDNVTTKTVQIKSGVSSWRWCEVTTMFDICSTINKAGNVYGLSTSKSVVDPHLMKNTEWGAVAYLSASIYGNSAITPNTSTTYITGTGGNTSSTTGNIYGIYDMSGGAHEYVAAYVNNGNNYLNLHGSSLVAAESKYKNTYPATGSGTSAAVNYGLLSPSSYYGDALYETSSTATDSVWYGDAFGYSYSTLCFFTRGNASNASKTALCRNFCMCTW